MAIALKEGIEVKELEALLKALPSIGIELDWDWNSYGDQWGSYENDEHELEFGQWFIRCGLQVSQRATTTLESYLQPSEFSSTGMEAFVDNIALWRGEEEIDVTPEQSKAIQFQIIKNIRL